MMHWVGSYWQLAWTQSIEYTGDWVYSTSVSMPNAALSRALLKRHIYFPSPISQPLLSYLFYHPCCGSAGKTVKAERSSKGHIRSSAESQSFPPHSFNSSFFPSCPPKKWLLMYPPSGEHELTTNSVSIKHCTLYSLL